MKSSMRFRLEQMPYGFLLLFCVSFCATCVLVIGSFNVEAQEADQPDDSRLERHRTLRDDYFPFHPPENLEEWDVRRERIQRQLLVATGLWPMPSKTPLNAVVHGKVEREGYTVEKAYFESYRGHFVTGNLYRPDGEGPFPGVLCPHGHWAQGRFTDQGEEAIAKQIEDGAEKYQASGRFHLQSRCAQLARMGCVVFHYDMVGYADSRQLEHRLNPREEMNTTENWGLASPQAELRLQNMMGLQTYNSHRALDFLCSLDDVDNKRLAMTGGSGGGTQTFMLSGIDPRLTVSFPAVMVSTDMQGGCTCENCSHLRINTSNVEFAALFAPKPLGMTAADDWTVEMETRGFPELQKLFALYGAEENVGLFPYTQFPHNYNRVSRTAMYGWMNEHLELGIEGPIDEPDLDPIPVAELSVWDDEHPAPASGDEYERSLVQWMTDDADAQMEALVPTDADSLEEFRSIVGGAVDVLVGRSIDEFNNSSMTKMGDRPQLPEDSEYCLMQFASQDQDTGEVMYGQYLFSKPEMLDVSQETRVVLWLTTRGKQTMFDEDGDPIPSVKRLLDANHFIIGLDLMGQGDYTSDGAPIIKTRFANDQHAGYTFGYNPSVYSQRVHDILRVIALGKENNPDIPIDIIALDGAGHWAAAARAQSGDAIRKMVIDTGGFRFADVDAFDDPDFIPGGAKYFDLPGMIALSAPQETFLLGEPEVPPVVQSAFDAADASDALTVSTAEGEEAVNAAIDWILE
jgi:dienelactone hydrolase